MKFLKYLVALVIGVTVSVSLASCGDDDDDEPQSDTKNEQTEPTSPYEALIVGNWLAEYDGYGIVFNADGSGYEYEYGYQNHLFTIPMVWTMSGSKLTIRYTGNNVSVAFIQYTILSFTETKLVLRDNYGDVETYIKQPSLPK